MSRTNRKTFYNYYSPRMRQRVAEDWFEGRGPIERDPYFNGRDGVRGTWHGESSRGPKGYCGWDDHDGDDSRWAKRGAAKVIRRRGVKLIKQELDIMEAGDDEEVFRYYRRTRIDKALRDAAYRAKRDARMCGWHNNYVKRSAPLSADEVRGILKSFKMRSRIEELERQLLDLKNTIVHKSMQDSKDHAIEVMENKIKNMRSVP